MLRATIFAVLALGTAGASVRPASAAEIWIEQSVGGADAPSYIWVAMSGVDGPIRAIQFGLDLPADASVLNPYKRTQLVDRLRLDWPECWTAPQSIESVMVGYFWCIGNCSESASQVVCISPGTPAEIEPAAPAFQRCDGTWVPFTVVASPHGSDGLPPGCAIAYSNVPLGESSWGCVKALYGAK